MELSQKEFDLLRQYVYEICGISLGNDKHYLIRHRLEPLIKAAGIPSFLEYYTRLKAGLIPNGKDEVISAVTTNETSFFRDRSVFETFRSTVLPELVRTLRQRKTNRSLMGDHKVRIWSAGASSGQESYSLAITIREYFLINPSSDVSANEFSILATDISPKILEKAMKGEYTGYETEKGLPGYLKAKYFLNTGTDSWTAVPAIREMVEFRCLNLMEPFAMLGPFDLIFCRNVLYYFDCSTRAAVFDQFHKVLTRSGRLFLGTTENIYPLNEKFKAVGEGAVKYYVSR